MTKSIKKAIIRSTLMLMLTYVLSVQAASAVLGGIDITGSSRGLVISLSADAPFLLTVKNNSLPSKEHLQISLQCSKVIYGLNEFAFNEFPRPSPIRQVVVKDNPQSGIIELRMTLTSEPDKQIQVKQKGNTWLILVTRKNIVPFFWSATENTSQVVSQPTSSVAQGAESDDKNEAHLIDISILVRDKIEQFTFLFNKPLVTKIKQDENKITILFGNAVSDLIQTRMPLSSSQISFLELQQINHAGSKWLGATATIKKRRNKGILVQTFPDRLVLYSSLDSVRKFAFWSIYGENNQSYNFIKIPDYDVDYKGIQKKIGNDKQGDISTVKTFVVSEKREKKPVNEMIAHVNQLPDQQIKKEIKSPFEVVVVKTSANLRAGPSTNDIIISKLCFGNNATQIDKKGLWVKIKTNDTLGWVLSTMVVDSSLMTREIKEQLENLRIKQVALIAASEKKAQLKAIKEKQIIEKQKKKNELQEEKQKILQEKRIAQEQQTQELLIKKQEVKDAEKKAALFRDSLVKIEEQKAAQKDSIDKIKKEMEPKPVEYHVFGRDPFLPLSILENGPIPNVEELNLVGILYDNKDKIGLLEDKKEKTHAYALRENDAVKNGYVLRVLPDKVLFLLNEMGISRTYVLKLVKVKEQ